MAELKEIPLLEVERYTSRRGEKSFFVCGCVLDFFYEKNYRVWWGEKEYDSSAKLVREPLP